MHYIVLLWRLVYHYYSNFVIEIMVLNYDDSLLQVIIVYEEMHVLYIQ